MMALGQFHFRLGTCRSTSAGRGRIVAVSHLHRELHVGKSGVHNEIRDIAQLVEQQVEILCAPVRFRLSRPYHDQVSIC